MHVCTFCFAVLPCGLDRFVDERAIFVQVVSHPPMTLPGIADDE